jgi:hypothetical protein
MKATDYRDWVLSVDAAPAISSPSSKHLYGWFYLTSTVLTATATATNLATKDAWYDDVKVRTAYQLADADPNLIQAHLRLEAFELIVASDDLAVTAANKVKLLTAAGRPYLYAKPENQDWVCDSVGAISDPVAQFELNFAAAAAAQHGLLKGTPKKVVGTMTVRLDTEAFTLKTDAGTGVGADLTMLVALKGAISPSIDGELAKTMSNNPNGSASCSVSNEIRNDRDVVILRNESRASSKSFGFTS